MTSNIEKGFKKFWLLLEKRNHRLIFSLFRDENVYIFNALFDYAQFQSVNVNILKKSYIYTFNTI